MNRILFYSGTANSSRSMATIAESANAVALPLDLPADGWFEIAPYGTHPAPDGSYVQIFNRQQAERVVATWNSLAGRGVRWIHNVKNGVGIFNLSAPVWEGHPDVDAQRWPQKNALAQITEIRVGATGLEGRATFNAEGMAQRGRGPLKPSPYWMHEAPDAQGRVFPELLLSVGLVPAPNISNAPAWTRNAPDQNTNAMTQSQIALALGLTANATWEEITSALNNAKTNATALATATANAANVQTQMTTLQTQITTANASLAALTTERDTLKTEKQTLTTANAALTTERDGAKVLVVALSDALLGLAEKSGQITSAEKETWKGKLTANAGVAEAAKELADKKPSLNTRPIEQLNTPANLATANARREAFQDAVKKEMKDNGTDYDTAFSRCMSKPELKPLVDAMSATATK